MRLEGMLDVLNMVRYFRNKSNGVSDDVEPLFGLALLAGPEMGRMRKNDRNKMMVQEYYVGLAGGLQARFRLHKWVSALVEPRFTLVPYTAPHVDIEAPSDRMNYYDALLNINLGLEVNIPALHRSSKRK